MEITRRGFIARAFSSFLGLIALSRCSTKPATPEEKLRKNLVGLFSKPESARLVGAEYLRAAKESGEKAFSNISSTLKEKFSASYTNTTKEQLKKFFSARRMKDFEEGRIVEVQGWILSVTEAQLCAVVTYDHRSN